MKFWHLLPALALSMMLAAAIPAVSASYDYPFVLKWGERGIGTFGEFSSPQYAAVDSNGSVYVTDLGNKRVQKFSGDGEFLTAWGNSGSLPGEFNAPAGIAVYGESVYVVDRHLHRVQQFDLDGNFVNEWGSKGSGDGEFLLPNGIDTDINGSVYVIDTGNQRVQVFTFDGEYVFEFGSSGTQDDKFLNPVGISVENGAAYVTDAGNNAVKKFKTDGTFIKNYDSSSGGLVMGPYGIQGDGDGNMYIADYRNNRILYLGGDGLAITSWGKGGVRDGDFMSPTDVVMDDNGYLFVTDTNGNRIQKFSSPMVREMSMPEEIPDAPEQEIPAEPEPIQGHPDTIPPILQLPNHISGDIVKPTILVPADLTVEVTGHLTAINIGHASAHDESGIQLLTNNAPSKFTLGTSTIIWTAIDGSGNLAVAPQQITVQDTMPPVITPMDNVTLLAVHPTLNLVLLNAPNVYDTLGVLSLTNDAPEHFVIGTTAVTWTAMDVVANTAKFVQYVHLVDIEPPVLYVPKAIVQEAVAVFENLVDLGNANVTDNSLAAHVGNDAPEYFPLGNTTVIWTATDGSGNSISDVQNVMITDTTAPQFDPINAILSEAVTAVANKINLTEPYAYDVQNFTISNNAPDAFPTGTTLITWVAVDAYGNKATAIQNVTIRDTTPPAINHTGDVIAEAAGPHGTPVVLQIPQTTDAISAVNVTNDAPDLYALGETNVTWIAADENGNNVSIIQKITVLDTIAPEITILTEIIAEAIGYMNNTVDIGLPVVYDIVGVENLTNDAPQAYAVGTTTVTWIASDESKNTANATQTVTIVDTKQPSITAPFDIIVEAQNPNGEPVAIGKASAGDAVGIFEVRHDAPEIFPFGITNVTWTATDMSGNSNSTVQTVTVHDTVPPSITAPQNVTIEAQSPASNRVELGVALADDAVGVVELRHNSPLLFLMGTTLITWTATDASGNFASDVQTVLVHDTSSPALEIPADITAEAVSANGTAIPIGDATATDIDEIEITNNAPELYAIGTTLVTWTATDASGNFASDVQTVLVHDTSSPAVAAPADITSEAIATNTPVNTGIAIAYDTAGAVSVTSDAPAAFLIGVTQVTWTATDGAGNTAFAVQEINIIDSTSPIVAAPANVAAEAQSENGAKADIGTATATDIGEVTISNNAPEIFPIGKTQVTWTAVDASGNGATVVQNITVSDTTAPVITAPANVTAEAVAHNTPVEIGIAKATDTAGRVLISNNAPKSFLMGSVQVTWTAADDSGNIAAVIQIVTVQDTTAPALTPPANVTAEAESVNGAVVAIGTATATDIGDVTISNNAPEIFPIGKTQVTWTAVDASGNGANAVQTVKVSDTVVPVIVAPVGITAEAESSDGTSVSLLDPQSADISGIASVTNNAPEKFQLGDTVVTWTLTDNYNNTATAEQTVSIVDTTPPVIDLPDTVVFEITGTSTRASLEDATAFDLVDGAVSVTNNAPESFGLEKVNITWTSTDASGNTAKTIQILEPNACGKPLSYYVLTVGTDLDDSIRGTAQPDLMFLLRGDDVVFGERGNDCIFGGQGSDVIFGGEGDDTLYGDEDGDVLRGDSGSDSIFGGEGYDIIDGGDGYDSCGLITDTAQDLTIRCE